jgi:hypothetical protein
MNKHKGYDIKAANAKQYRFSVAPMMESAGAIENKGFFS